MIKINYEVVASGLAHQFRNQVMTVSELIAFLQTMPQDLQVGYSFESDWAILIADDIDIFEACEPRNDGWIESKRPDKPAQKYLMFPGS